MLTAAILLFNAFFVTILVNLLFFVVSTFVGTFTYNAVNLIVVFILTTLISGIFYFLHSKQSQGTDLKKDISAWSKANERYPVFSIILFLFIIACIFLITFFFSYNSNSGSSEELRQLFISFLMIFGPWVFILISIYLITVENEARRKHFDKVEAPQIYALLFVLLLFSPVLILGINRSLRILLSQSIDQIIIGIF